MKRFYRPVPAVMAAAVISVCSACGAEPPSEESLLTPEELIRAAGLTKEQYRGVDLERFIEDFAITEEDVDVLNIPLLLQEYDPDAASSDVNSILEDDITERAAAYTENVHAIAFLENRATDTECVYYDLENGRRYRTSNEYLFSDLGQAEPEDYADGQQMAEALDEYGEVREMLLSGEHSGI